MKARRELRRRQVLAMACLAVYLYVAAWLLGSLLIDGPPWLWIAHVAVVALALVVQFGTLFDVATRRDWRPAERAAWRRWIWGFSLLAVLVYFWLHMEQR